MVAATGCSLEPSTSKVNGFAETATKKVVLENYANDFEGFFKKNNMYLE